MKRFLVVLVLVVGLAAPAMATPVMVTNTGTSPGVTLNVILPWIPYGNFPGGAGAYVGVENLIVGGVGYQGFCIDLRHFSQTGPLPYNIDDLALSPASMPMGTPKADFIKEMWAYGFTNAISGNNEAAGFQLAIWGVIEGSMAGDQSTPDFTWLGDPTKATTLGAVALINFTNANQGALANVVGLNHDVRTGSAQSYAIEVPVPDGGSTLTLLGGVLMGVGALRRKLRA